MSTEIVVREKIARGVVPISLIAISAIITITLYTLFPFRDTPDLEEVALYLVLTIFAFIVVGLYQIFVHDKRLYFPLAIGWGLIYIGLFESLVGQIIDYNNFWLYIIFAPMIPIGIMVSAFGTYLWGRKYVETESKFEALDSRYRELVSAIPVGVIITDGSNVVTFANDESVRILSTTDKQLINKHLSEVIPIEKDVEKIERAISEFAPSTLESVVLRESGNPRFLSTLIMPYKNDRNELEGCITLLVDVTLARMAEVQHEQQTRVNELYTSLIRHDMGNDLQAVLGFIETAQMFPEGCNPKILELLDSAFAVGTRMSRLVKAFGVTESSDSDDILSIITRIAKEAEVVDRNLKIQISASPEVEKAKIAGLSLLPMAFENILRNASEHAGDNPIVDINMSVVNGSVLINISDNGQGFTSDMRDKIFTRGRAPDEGGWGLYLTKQIVTACGGSVVLLEGTGKGAGFSISLPSL